MSKTKTTEQYIEEAKAVHGDKYDYSKVEYKGTHKKICVICPEHGEFWQEAKLHLNSYGCPKCARIEAGKNIAKSKGDFVEKSKQVHGDKYDYSEVNYKDCRTPVTIICKEHGKFTITPTRLLNSIGCPQCFHEKRVESNRMSNETALEKIKEIFGPSYDYSKFEYIDSNHNVKLICKKHGEFEITPRQIFHESGECPECSKEKKLQKKILKEWEELLKSKQKEEKKLLRKIKLEEDERKKQAIKEEKQKLREEKERKKIEAEMKKALKKKQKFNKEDYLKEQETKKILKNEEHKLYALLKQLKKEQKIAEKELKKSLKYQELLKKQEEIKQKKAELTIQRTEDKKKKWLENFIFKATEKHKGYYSYEKTTTPREDRKVCITCPVHGDFWTLPGNHVNGHGCPQCAYERTAKLNRFTKEQFIEKAKQIHGDKYDYSEVEYINSSTKIKIICPKHGVFWQTPIMHTADKQGCPICGNLASKEEIEIVNFLRENLKTEIQTRNKKIIYPLEIDVYIPKLNFALEYDGLRWHSEQFGKQKFYHLNKTEKCFEKGITLIHIFEDEWRYKKDITKAKLIEVVGIQDKSIKIEKPSLRIITKNEAENFLKSNDLNGYTKSTINIGTFFDDEIVAVLSASKNKENWYLNRLCLRIDVTDDSILRSLFEYFVNNFKPTTIFSSLDRRWVTDRDNNCYTKLGFVYNKTTPPNFVFVSVNDHCKRRFSKYEIKKNVNQNEGINSNILPKKEICEKYGYYRIWDCGMYEYVWTK